MGYTHYWSQKRAFTADKWRDASQHIGEILKHAEHVRGIPLANANGDAGSRPEFLRAEIMLNGVGDSAHETFAVSRKPDRKQINTNSFCKTARKPYDIVVKACLSYLSTVAEIFDVTSDGDGSEWLDGVELARDALPRFANVLDIPMEIMKSDRWVSPWVSGWNPIPFEVRFCIDGRGYVLRKRTGESYCFETHRALAKFLDSTKRVIFRKGGDSRTMRWPYPEIEENIWSATGSFDAARHARIAKSQTTALAPLFPVDPTCARQPPAFARPNQMPSPETPSYYSIGELLAAAETTA